MNKVIFLLLICFGQIPNLFGQTQFWDLITYSGQPYNHVILHDLKGDTLQLKAFGNVYSVHIDSITSIESKRKSHAGAGLMIGLIAGGIIGNRIANNSANKEGFLSDLDNSMTVIFGTTLGFGIGGLIGFTTGKGLGKNEYYDISKRSYSEKQGLLSELINRSQ